MTPTKASRKVVAMIGFSVGSRMILKTCQWVHPSMVATSSSSRGIMSKVPLMSHTWSKVPPTSARLYPASVLRPRKGTTWPEIIV